MNCDDAFEALTDPSRRQSTELAQHLAGCPRCRDLEQILEPALALLEGEPVIEGMPTAPVPRATARQISADSSEESKHWEDSAAIAESAAAELLAAARLTTDPEPRTRRPSRFVTRRLVHGALRSAALILVGAFAAYGVINWQRESSSPSVPAVSPGGKPAGSCTRHFLADKPGIKRDAAKTILSCVACHFRENAPPKAGVPSTLIWPPRRETGEVIVVNCVRPLTVRPENVQVCELTRGDVKQA